MNPDEVRDLIAGGTLAVPYTIRTRGGETYTVESAADVRITEACPDTLIIERRGFTIAIVRLGSIVAITPLAPGSASAPEREGGPE